MFLIWTNSISHFLIKGMRSARINPIIETNTATFAYLANASQSAIKSLAIPCL